MVQSCNERKGKNVQKLIAQRLGPKLIHDHGKKKYYTKKEIDRSYSGLDIPIDFQCWGYSMYMDHQTFDKVHISLGEACDFSSMKTEMLNLVPTKADASWFDFDWDFSDLNLSEIVNLDILSFFDL